MTNSASSIDYSDLHHKSKLNSKRISNAKMSFINPTQHENKKTNDRLVTHDLLFHDMFLNDASKKDFKVEFENEALSNEFINKNIDIYAGSYSYECH
ncbi:exotoxin OB-fold domain-containing protein, partial [Staphylococcus aureus]|uniref:exotoxin OB-fold domain-containing protein n=1 Tax=Staphylococcus aureus TaxID=1280 RepID=UPI000A8E2807